MKQKVFKKIIAASVSATLAFAPLVSSACSSFILKGSDNGLAYGRSMEFGFPLNSELMTIPRAFAMQGVGVDGKPGTGLNWTTKYAAVGMNAVGWPAYVDGMNEKGLIGAMFNAPNSAVFENVAPADSASSISSAQVPVYVLTNFATVDEIKAGLSKIKVNRSPVGPYNNQIAAVHYSFHDASGKSIVVEYLNGQLVITDNPVGALTNDPPFRDQLNSIGNYANLTKVERAPLVINGAKFSPPSSGSGLHGLPGGFLSPDRFIRAVFLSDSVPKTFTTQEMEAAAWHVVGGFDIPPGAVTLPASNPYGGGTGGYETTEWSIVANSKSLVYNVKMYANTNIYTFDLKKMDVNAKEIKYTKLDQPRLAIPVN